MAQEQMFDVCEANGDCQRPAIVRWWWSGRRPSVFKNDGRRLCAIHAAVAQDTAAALDIPRSDYYIESLIQPELPFSQDVLRELMEGNPPPPTL